MNQIFLNIFTIGILSGFHYRWALKIRHKLLPNWIIPAWFLSFGLLFLSISGYLLFGNLYLYSIYVFLFPSTLGIGWILHCCLLFDSKKEKNISNKLKIY